MVGEPVQATVETLRYFYDQAVDITSNHSDVLSHIDLGGYNPFKIIEQPVLRHNKISHFPFLKRHRIKLSVLTIGIGIAGFIYYRKKGSKAPKAPALKRRVPKLANGARQDVVLVIGSPTEPLTRLLALDFDRRGFIVYLTILDQKDLKYTESNSITDGVNYLNLTDSYSFESQLQKFTQLLKIPVVPFPGADYHNLKLVGVVFAPCLYFPIGPLENISIASWSKVVEKISVYLKLFSSGLVGLIREQKAKTILVSPSITSTLNMPYHGPEAMFQNSLQSLFTTFTREIRQHKLSVTQVRLGNISVSSNLSTNLRTSSIINSEVRGWNEDIKSLYQDDFSKSQYRANPIKSTGKGTSLRDLYHLLFDLIYSKNYSNAPVVYCGTGARSYDYLSSILPYSIVSYILA